MLVEGLVIFSCTIGHCPEALSSYNHYYPENPYVQAERAKRRWEKKGEELVKENCSPYLLNVVFPAAAWMVKQEFTTGLGKNQTLSFKITDNYQTMNLGYSWSF